MLAVITVTNLNDAPVNTPAAVGTLRQAIFDANATPSVPDIIEFAPALAGTIHLAIAESSAEGGSALLISSPITIRGNANGITIGRNAPGPEMRLFHVTTTGDLTLETTMVTGGLARGINGAAPGQTGGNGRGGAVLNEGALTVIGSTLHGNTAIGGNGLNARGGSGIGGAIANAGGTVTIKNSTVSTNSVVSGLGTMISSSFGGGVHSVNGQLAIHNSTLTLNVATTGKQVYVVGRDGTAVFEIRSSIATSGDSTLQSRDIAVLEDTNGQFQVTASKIIVGTQFGLDNIDYLTDNPQLGPLADNGGPTWTHAISDDSPALNNGENTLDFTSDQRGIGFTRVVGGLADIGAFELQATVGLRGDYNANGSVEAADYVAWRKLLGAEVTPFQGADGDGSGEIDLPDYGVWFQEYGASTSIGLGSNGSSGESRVATNDATLAQPQAIRVLDADLPPLRSAVGTSRYDTEDVRNSAVNWGSLAEQPALLRLIDAVYQSHPIVELTSSTQLSESHRNDRGDELEFTNADDPARRLLDGDAVDVDAVWVDF